MPNLDKTGPDGKGPLTGLGRGNCQGAKKTAVTGTGRAGMGLKRGNGLGRRAGCCRRGPSQD